MRLVAYFEDSPKMMAHRANYEKDHLEYLKENIKEIPIAGGLRPEPGGVFVGGAHLVQAYRHHRRST